MTTHGVRIRDILSTLAPIVLSAALFAEEQGKPRHASGQRYGLDVQEMKRRLPPGQRVVKIEPPLEDEDYVLPPRLADRADAIERLPAGKPIVTIEVDDDATIRRGKEGSVATGELPMAEALVYLSRHDSGFFFTTKTETGTFQANQLILDDGFLAGYVAGSTPLTGFDFLVLNSSFGPSGPADVEAELWNGDPVGLVDVHCGPPAPIAGTSCTFSDLPDASQGPCATGPMGIQAEPCVGLHKLRCTFPVPVTVDCDSVWLVWRPTRGCRIGWRLAGELGNFGSLHAPAEIGSAWAFTARVDCGQLNRCGSVANPGCSNDASGRNCGTCCDNGLPPNAGGTPCDHSDGSMECSHATFCTDGVAELDVVTTYTPGDGYYASYVATVYAQARVPLYIIPAGNGPNGALDPDVTIVGNEIFLPSPGRTVFLEARIGDWDPDDTGVQLQLWDITLDGAGYSTGRAGALAPKLVPCGGDADCVSAFGSGATCDTDLGTCGPAFVDMGRGGQNRFVFTEPALCGGFSDEVGLDVGCVIPSQPSSDPFEDDPVPFPVGGLYGGTYVLNVPSDAQGTFTLDAAVPWPTYLVDQDYERIRLIGTIPAKIHLPCVGAPELGGGGVARGRYLAVRPKTGGRPTALRLTLENLLPPYDSFNGRSLWVGPHRSVSELSGSSDAGLPGFRAATLQCTPHFTDWHGVCDGTQCVGGLRETATCLTNADCAGEVQVYHAFIVPGGRYFVQAFDGDCTSGVGGGFSPGLAVTTTRWGDPVGAFGGGAWGSPDGNANIVTDVTALLDKFRNAATAPVKAQCDIQPSTPDQLVDISDVTQALNAFRSLPYPFPPTTWPCAGTQ